MAAYRSVQVGLGQALYKKQAQRLLQGARLGIRVKPPTGLPERVSVRVRVNREGEPSNNFLVTLVSDETLATLAVYTPNTPSIQWFRREAVYRTVIAQAYEYTEPRMGITRWPTIGEGADTFLFNVTESDGGNQVSTVPAIVDVAAAVEAVSAVRKVAIVELMDDGQWRVAGYGDSVVGGIATLDLRVTTTGTLFALGIDDMGASFVPGLLVTLGDRIRPNHFKGWLYVVTQAGALADLEPEWWPVEGDNAPRLCGTARVQAVRYYRPLAHGPITVEMT